MKTYMARPGWKVRRQQQVRLVGEVIAAALVCLALFSWVVILWLVQP